MNCTVTIILQELHHTQICWIIDCMHYNPSTGLSTSFSRVPSESEPYSVRLFMRWDQAMESPPWRRPINWIHQALYHSQPQVPTTLCINYKHQNLLLFSLFPPNQKFTCCIAHNLCRYYNYVEFQPWCDIGHMSKIYYQPPYLPQ